MPPLLRGIKRTAVVAGAAAVSKRISRRQTGRWSGEDESQANDELPDEEQPAEEQPPADDMSATIEQLRQLAELRTQGVLTDAEFEQQKARVLGN
jgi:hypothetical protein